MNVSDRIKYLRQLRGMTLDEIAELVGVSNATVSRWETGEIKNIRSDKFEVLAKALKTTTAYLHGYIDDPDPGLNYNKLIRDLMKIDIQRANDREGMRLLSIPDVDLDIAVQLADAELLDTVHRICGMNDQDLSDVAAAGRIHEVWNPEKINIVRSFIEDNEKTLRKMMKGLEK